MDGIWFGVDFGSKLSGNTVVAIHNHGKIFFMDMDAGVDADEFIKRAAQHFKPEYIFLDAPLSLPGIYRGIDGCCDYNFRKADRDLCAMSPMFLGGLTARAMRLKSELMNDLQIEVYETYPKVKAQELGLMDLGYKGRKIQLISCRNKVLSEIDPDILIDCNDIKTWHHLDALLALVSAMNLKKEQVERFGDPVEGQIII
ncbi:MAG: DUF429 domain-containing protein [Bacteroidota bacterium]|nr:DUF429 domain-containing protein [Bacteroidota bacterium]MDX5504677.1 DUF429 domain-containing protein [Bacteroidota bacterium]